MTSFVQKITFLLVLILAFVSSGADQAAASSSSSQDDLLHSSHRSDSSLHPATGQGVQAFRLTPGFNYSSDISSNNILQIDRAGVPVASMEIQGYSEGLRGLSFGPDGTLYVVALRGNGYHVLVLDDVGSIIRIYEGPDYVRGDAANGKLAIANDASFFVSGGGVVRRYQKNQSTGEIVFQATQVHDVDVLPNQRVAVATDQYLFELTKTGDVVRQIAPDVYLSGVRALMYSAETDIFYVTMLGGSSGSFQLMRIDSFSGQVVQSIYHWYGTDFTVTDDRQVIVGSFAQAPAIYPLNLSTIGFFSTGRRMFVAHMHPPAFRFSDSFE